MNGNENEPLLTELLIAGEHCDDKLIHHLLLQAFHEYGTLYLIHSVVSPLLVRIGERWQSGEWSEHQEHISSLAIRDFLVQIRGMFPELDKSPVILAACLPYEKHEIPLHLILLEARLKGWRTVFLGASPAPGALEHAVEQLLPRKVVVSATTSVPFEQDPEALAKLDALARKYPHISFYLGGTGAWNNEQSRQLKYVILTNDIKEMLKNGIGENVAR
jgi:hypothetical protein